MPILAPDRNKGKIAGAIMQRMFPSHAMQMRMGTEQNFANMAQDPERAEKIDEDTTQAGAMALRALFSAAQDGDFEACYRAYVNLHKICDAQLENEEGEEY